MLRHTTTMAFAIIINDPAGKSNTTQQYDGASNPHDINLFYKFY